MDRRQFLASAAGAGLAFAAPMTTPLRGRLPAGPGHQAVAAAAGRGLARRARLGRGGPRVRRHGELLRPPARPGEGRRARRGAGTSRATPAAWPPSSRPTPTEFFVRYTLLNAELAMPHMPATACRRRPLRHDRRRLALARHSLPSRSGRPPGSSTSVDPGRRAYHLNLPLYNGVTSLEIGVPKGATLRAGRAAQGQADPVLRHVHHAGRRAPPGRA